MAERGADVVGVDISPKTIEVARRLNPGVRFEIGDMLDLGDRGWAAVVALYSIIHIERRRVPDALTSIHGALRPDGLFVVAVHAGEGEIRHDEFMGKQVPFTGTFFKRDELVGLIEDAGFMIERAVVRDPYEQEAETRRIYVVARASDAAHTLE